MSLARNNHRLTNLLRWLMLLIFTFEHTPLASAAIYLAASWSGEHEVQLQNTVEKTTIVLHHQGLARQHSSLTKALLVLTNVTEDGQRDHVLGCVVASTTSVDVSSKLADPRPIPLVDALIQPAELTVFKIGIFTTSLRSARPPPLNVIVSASTLDCLKTIVLLV
jgi:hypothetical protein